jgi:hypothetical protein
VKRQLLARLGAAAAVLLVATAAAAGPVRVTLVRPARLDPVAVETITRLQAELVAAGFEVVVADAGSERSESAAVVTLVGASRGTVEVLITDPASPATSARPVQAGVTGESSRAAALAIRTVELLRAGLSDRSNAARAPSPGGRPVEASLDDSADLVDAAPPARPRAGRALYEGPSAELGLAAIYGLGDATGRLAPVLRVAYGSPIGLAGRLTLLGTSTDQAALVEAVYGFGKRWRVAPVMGLGAGGCHTHLDDTATPRFPRLRTEAWGGVLSAGAGVAARVIDRVAFLVDAHAWLVELAPGAIVGAAPAGSGPRAMATMSLGVVAGF